MLQAALSERPRSSFKTRPDSSWALDDLVERDYSLARVIRDGPALRGFEREVSQELARVYERQPAGVFVPSEVLAIRDLSAGIASAGGVSIELEVAKSLIPVLRNRSVTVAM